MVDSRGFILTAQAVVAGASHVGVAIPGTGVVDAHIVGSDRVTAITMLKVDTTGLKAIELAQPGNPRRRQWGGCRRRAAGITGNARWDFGA